MTNREFFTAIVTGTLTINKGRETEESRSIFTEDGAITEEMRVKASELITALDNKNAARRNSASNSKTAKENEEYRTKIRELLADGAKTAKMIAKALTTEENEISTQKVNSIVKTFPEGEIITYQDKDGKKNTVNFFKLAE